MPNPTPRILIVEDDPDIAEMLAEHLGRSIPAHITVAQNASEALKADLGHPHDLILADVLLPDANALDLIRQINDMNDPQVVLMTGQPTLGRAVEAMRLGVRDLFTKPFDLVCLTAALRRLIDQQQELQAQKNRNRRLRNLSTKILRERRHLRQRLDLLCKDFVDAYRRLAEKVVSINEQREQ